jgi:hypothetical protein
MSNIAVFRARIGTWQQRVGDRADALTQGVAAEVFDNVHDGGDFSPGTPIEEGVARSSWNAKVGRLSAPARAGSPEEARQLAFAEIATAKVGDPVFIANSADHIRQLEFGSSTQAPGGFVRLLIHALGALVEKVAARITGRGGQDGTDG